MGKRHELGELIDDELEQLASNCKPGCPGPELLEVARGGHNCDVAIERTRRAEVLGLDSALLEHARATAAGLEDQLARIEALARDELNIADDASQHVLARDVLDIVTGADVERRDALAALAAAEPVVPS